jgi:tetratricopeptide (TPR) repeat protein
VGATDQNDYRAPYSNVGSQLNAVAPGGYGETPDANDIYSTTPNYSFVLEDYGITRNYGYMAGTSMATPHVSGIAALLLSVNPNLTPAQIKTILEQSAEDKGTAGRDDYYGYGRVNAYKALKYSLENYGGTISQSFTIPSGETWNFQPGVTVKFASGVTLTSNGAFNVNGSAGSPVTFTSVSGTTPGSWGSIVLSGTGANGSSISYANILYGTEVRLNNVASSQIQHTNISNTINGIYAYNSVCTANDNQLNYQRDHGIIVYNSSVECTRNTITKSDHSGAGMLYTAGGYSMSGRQNDIYGYNWGIGSSYGAYVRFPNSGQKNNQVRSCLYGLHVYQKGTLYIPSTTYGRNSIRNNTYYNAYVHDTGYVYASYNYWGWPVPTNKFYCQSGSYLDYSSALDIDPWREEEIVSGNPPFADIQSGIAKQTHSGSLLTVSGTDDVAAQARALRDAGKNQEAFDLLKTFFESGEFTTAAVSELYMLHAEPLAKNVEEVLSLIPVEKAPLGQYYYGLILSRKGEPAEALAVFEKLTGTSFERAGTLARFYVYLYDLNNVQSAEHILSSLSAKNSDEEFEFALAQHSLNTVSGKTGEGESPKSPDNNVISTTSVFGLKPNYPNPFNPMTTIVFTLQSSGFASLKIYDVLGREVATLVNENLEAGVFHQRAFDASRLPSGVYYYALKSRGKQEVRKMLYLK